MKNLKGTDFQKMVWNEIKKIPKGKTITYKELAIRIGKPKACRAVANACAKNPLLEIIPCHRVIRSDGKMGGYMGKKGIERKTLSPYPARGWCPSPGVVPQPGGPSRGAQLINIILPNIMTIIKGLLLNQYFVICGGLHETDLPTKHCYSSGGNFGKSLSMIDARAFAASVVLNSV